MYQHTVIATAPATGAFLCAYFVVARTSTEALAIIQERALLHELREVAYEVVNPVDLSTEQERRSIR